MGPDGRRGPGRGVLPSQPAGSSGCEDADFLQVLGAMESMMVPVWSVEQSLTAMMWIRVVLSREWRVAAMSTASLRAKGR